MNFKESIKKVKEFDYGKFFGSKAFLIGGCVLIIAAAIVVNAIIPTSAPEIEAPADGGAHILGNSVLAGASGNEEQQTGTSYFEEAVINRENTRNEAMEVLKAIADSPDALVDAKEQAMLDIATIAEEMSAEATIEQLVKAKGFEKCVCVVSGGKASVVVNAKDQLSAAQVAQILEIVYLETGILPANTKVMSV